MRDLEKIGWDDRKFKRIIVCRRKNEELNPKNLVGSRTPPPQAWGWRCKSALGLDLSHSDTRLSMLLNGFELHVYNRSQLYSRLEHLFGLEPSIIPSGSEPYWQDSGGEGDTQTPVEKHDTVVVPKYEWRDLIPVIKAEISTGRLVFGNRLLPTTLSVNFEEAHIIYTTKPASSRLDQFTHITKCKAENFKVILAPSPKYTGLSDEPPRYMGEGFVVFQSNYVDLYYYQDEAGIVTAEPEMVELADGDVVQRSTAPLWGLDIKCGKGTDFSYGPWADRQREHLYKFFFPQDFQTLEITKQNRVGEKRFCESFDIRLSTLAEATIDILFSKEKETNAVHMNVGQGSYLEVTIPMRITEEGYISRLNGQLLHLEASTSLQYRSLIESETLEFDVQMKYPRIWNDHQAWTCSLTGCKATVHLIYAHKHFFHALMEDWASKSRPDILHFVPYTWHFNLILKEFELITVVNEYNWIDCSSQHQENKGEHPKSSQGPPTNLMRGLVARPLFKVPPCRKGTIHLQTSMSSPGFEPSPNGTAVSVANHYTGWATKKNDAIY
ncbi:transmembrane protein KIAA1109 [Trichonephila clavipes]|nr:transmembrane protein KIAA1109 [Trichonephila clavipes]